MNRPSSFFAALSIVLISFAASPRQSKAQVLANGLVYTSIQPCRVFDTRFATNGTNHRLNRGVAQTFNLVGGNGTSGYFTGQGGHNGGCSIPGFATGSPQVQAVFLNIVVVNPAGPGNLVAWPTDQGQSLSSVLNYSNATVANGIALPIRQDLQGGD